MKKNLRTALLGGCLSVILGGQVAVLAIDPELPVAGPSGGAGGTGFEQPVVAPALGLMEIFERGSHAVAPSLRTKGTFATAGQRRTASHATISSAENIRALFRDEFYPSLVGGVAILDRTLAEFALRKGKSFQLSENERRKLAAVVDEVVRPLLLRYHTGYYRDVRSWDLFETVLTLTETRHQVYQRIFQYLLEDTTQPAIREFMQEHFEPSSELGSFVPRARSRAEFLTLWTKHFQAQPGYASFFPPMTPERWNGLLSAYHRQLWNYQGQLGPDARQRVKQGMEGFFRLIVGWAPLEQAIDAKDRTLLQKLSLLPFRDEVVQQRFTTHLMALAGRDVALGQRSSSSYEVLQAVPVILATLREASDYLRETYVPGPAEGQADLHARELPAHESLRPLFQKGRLAADRLWARLDTKTFAGLLGAQTLLRLQHTTLTLEATLAEMGVWPQGSQRERLQRLAALLAEGYERYHRLDPTEGNLFRQLRLIEDAYWKEVEKFYPETVRQGKFGADFLPTPEATPAFVRSFSQQAAQNAMPVLSVPETNLLQNSLPSLQTPEGVAEIAHLLLARGAAYQPGVLPGLDQVRRKMQEYELHPIWVSKRDRAFAQVIRDLAVLYHDHPSAPQLRHIEPVLRRLLAVGFGADAPAAQGLEQRSLSQSVDERRGSEAGPRLEASPPVWQEERERAMSFEAMPAGRTTEELHPHSSSGPR